MRHFLLAFAAALLFLSPVHADDRKVVEAFYTDLLSNPSGDDLDARVRNVISDDWVTEPAGRNGPGAAGFTKTLAGFGAAIPNLNWDVQEILQDGNRYIVRSIATGTPEKPLFGVEPKGKSFEIMTIDIHTVKDGRIVQSYHVEEWLKAVAQLKAD